MKVTSIEIRDFDKIYPDWGLGVKWLNDEGKLCTTVSEYSDFRDGKRIVEFCITSFVGVGGMHYYGSFRVHTPYWKEQGLRKSVCSGYGGKNKPQEIRNPIHFEICRVLSKLEKDLQGDPVGRIGSSTIRFDDVDSLKSAAIILFKQKFAPGWVLVQSEGFGLLKPKNLAYS